jgi:hypothetical protein
VPPKVKGRKRDRDADKPLSGLDVNELLRGEKRLRISPENAIPEFKQTLANTADIKVIEDAVKQMCGLVEDQIKDSLGDINYDRAIEGLGTMREELIAFEEPNLYNQFIRRLKQKLLNDELNGDRREMWWLIRRHKLGLIAKIDSEQSDISLQEAREVSWSLLTGITVAPVLTMFTVFVRIEHSEVNHVGSCAVLSNLSGPVLNYSIVGNVEEKHGRGGPGGSV